MKKTTTYTPIMPEEAQELAKQLCGLEVYADGSGDLADELHRIMQECWLRGWNAAEAKIQRTLAELRANSYELGRDAPA